MHGEHDGEPLQTVEWGNTSKNFGKTSYWIFFAKYPLLMKKTTKKLKILNMQNLI